MEFMDVIFIYFNTYYVWSAFLG